MAKYRQAGHGFFVLSTLYLIVVFIFLPSFHLDLPTVAIFWAYLLTMGVLSYFIYKGKRILALILALIFAVRSAVSIYTLIIGQVFPAVPYVLPLLLLNFYLLGRALWAA